ncbi:hypothetical protein C9374_004228 [Naegleria lovaniensis]|uniref:Aminotransferase class I/classII large domain-containing protein n=1 Tax=Naegleria lovaniensis TaxID=51637 RepID=A0AA88GSI3_NAELO|nr:uncharacterized protein C9374_004228 [Naegleria lovaniensis]KAG2383557.1 hypothetical protein C9374_004228 [Naegleria lovaniensis]
MASSTTRILDYTPFLSLVSRLRKPSPIRALMPIMSLPGMISLAGGLPNASTFPFQSINVDLKTTTTPSTLSVDGQLLADSLQYHPSQGLPQLTKWLREHQRKTHSLSDDEKKEAWDVILTTGSQDGLTKAFEMFLNPYCVQEHSMKQSSDILNEDIRDAIIIERPTYSGSLSTLFTLSPHMIEVDVDQFGLIPEKLEESVEEFKKKHPKTMIKFLYTIPNGQNPSGCSLTLERKKKIYALSQKYNFLILEDDPYYYLALDNPSEPVPSFLSMDTDGRVLRFDSLSKILSSGIRCGFVTGPIQLINQMVLHIQASNLHSCGLSQGIVYALLSQWGEEGFAQHVKHVQKFYTAKRNELIECIDRHLKDYVEYSIPVCGMFVWMKLKGIPDSLKFIEQKARQQNVLMLPGTYFYPSQGSVTPYVRASFSIASKEQMEEACKRLAILIKEELDQ